MGKYIPTNRNNPCPICEKVNGNCRIVNGIGNGLGNGSGNLVLCMTYADKYAMEYHPDYQFAKQSKDGLWGIYYSKQDKSTRQYHNPYNSYKTSLNTTQHPLNNTNGNSYHNREKRDGLDENSIIEDEKGIEVISLRSKVSNVPIGDRDEGIRLMLNQLGLTKQSLSLLYHRGFNDDNIERLGYRSVKQWQPFKSSKGQSNNSNSQSDNESYLGYGVNRRGNLVNPVGGILIPIPYMGQYQALRLYNPERRPKYQGFKGSHLPNGEFPLALYDLSNSQSNTLNESNTLWVTEGLEFKPALTAIKFNVAVLGHNGANFTSSPYQTKQVIDGLAIKTVIIAPDGGVTQNKHLVKQYEKAIMFYRALGVEVKIAWWGQFSKDEGDIDEVNPRWVNLITPTDFYYHCYDLPYSPLTNWLSLSHQTKQSILSNYLTI